MNKNITDQIVTRIDIIDHIQKYVQLSRNGNNWVGLCPFHADKHPSFFVSQQKQIFKCFACGVGGNVIKFEMYWNKLGWKKAIASLNEAYRLNLQLNWEQQKTVSQEQRILIEMLEDVKNWFQINLYGHNQKQLNQFLTQRQIDKKTIETWQLGWAPKTGEKLLDFLKAKGYSIATILESRLFTSDLQNNLYNFFQERLIFPIYNAEKQLVGFVGRKITTNHESDGELKYLSFPNTKLFTKSQLLFNYRYPHQKQPQQQVYLVEGILDAIRLNLKNVDAVALMGTNCSRDQVDLISEVYQKVIIWLDSDRAGWYATLKTIRLFLKSVCRVAVIQTAAGNDPDQWILAQPKAVLPTPIEPLTWLLQQQVLDWTIEHKEELAPYLQLFWKNASYKAQQVAKPQIQAIFGNAVLKKITEGLQLFAEAPIDSKAPQSSDEEEAIWVLLFQYRHLFAIFKKHQWEFTSAVLNNKVKYLKQWYNQTNAVDQANVDFLNQIVDDVDRQFLLIIWQKYQNFTFDHHFINDLFNYFQKKRLVNIKRNLIAKLEQTKQAWVDQKWQDLLVNNEQYKEYVSEDWQRQSTGIKKKKIS